MKLLIALCCILFPYLALAAEPARWEMLPEQSSISFTATQNHAPVKGEFADFSTDIYFDPAQLAESHIRAEIDMASVTTSYEEVEENLRQEEWFFVDKFPKAEFDSNTITHQEDNRYIADGTLTIRGHAIPVSLPFTLDISKEAGKTIAHVLARVSLKRTMVGIGKGEWEDTSIVGDDVEVTIELVAEREGI